MVKADDIRKLVGEHVTLSLAKGTPGAPTVKGRITRAIEAADGLVVFLEPDSAVGTRVSYHYHHIVGIARQS